jgi:hypothetical protein
VLRRLSLALLLAGCSDRPIDLPPALLDLAQPVDLARRGDLSQSPDLRLGDRACGAGHWRPISTKNAPGTGTDHLSVWTGSELIDWVDSRFNRDGSEEFVGQGGRYDPESDTWRSMNAGGPTPIDGASVVWTGQLMIIWGGGLGGPGKTDLGTTYDPATDQWHAVSTLGAPSSRYRHTAVWTGSRMIVWGGQPLVSTGPNTGSASDSSASGASYDPAGDTWSPVSSANAPSVYSATAAWTGKEMLIWGGNFSMVGASAYDPAADRWRLLATRAAPSGLIFDAAVWSGTRLLVWSGSSGTRTDAYDPSSDSWSSLPDSAPSLSARSLASAVWGGTRAYFFGGMMDDWQPVGGGAALDPSAAVWTPLPDCGEPSPRFSPVTAWTGSELIVWRGECSGGSNFANSATAQCPDGAIYTP